MLKKLVFLLFFCLFGIGSIASASGPYNNQMNWGPVSSSVNWFDSNNWGTNPGNWSKTVPASPVLGPPDMTNWACMEDKGRLDINDVCNPHYGDNTWPDTNKCSYNTSNTGARAGQLFIHPWSWAGAGPCQLVMVSGDANMGNMIGLCNMMSFDSATQGYAQLDVNGGTMYTGGSPNILDYNRPCDLNETNVPSSEWIQGIGLQLGPTVGSNWGVINIRDGNLIVQRINIYYGDINVLGGLLYQTDPCSTYFSISLSKPKNRINIGGGELRIKGDNRERVNYYVGKGRVLAFENRGMLSVDFNGTDTRVTAVGSVYNAWNPAPKHQAINVSRTPTLTWNPGDAVMESGGKHHVFFGSDVNAVIAATTASSEYKGATDACNFPVTTSLEADTSYYWRIDEVNDFNGNSPWKGWVWSFRTLGGAAVEPSPADGTVGLPVAAKLGWMAGAFAVDHELYIGIDYNNVTDATLSNLLGTTQVNPTTNSFALGSLTWDLARDTNYFWRVDEVNGANRWKGATWMFRNTNYLVVEDFNEYETSDDMNQNWKTGFVNNCYGDISHAGLAYDNYGDTRVMRFSYVNTGGVKYSEARLEANGGAGADWTGGGALPAGDPVTGIAVKYLGTAANTADPKYDRLYLALEDTSGNFYVQSVPDGNATRNSFGWTEWNIKLTDLGAPTLNLASMRYLYLGSGDRVGCNIDVAGGTGTVSFDDIRLYQTHCVADLNPQIGDVTSDCKVNYDDIDYMVNNWLTADTSATLAVSAPTTGPTAWYKFDEAGGTTASDFVHPEANNATVLNPGLESALWSPAGGYDGSGCINLVMSSNTLVQMPSTVLSFFNSKKAVSMSIWIKMDYYAPTDSWARLIEIGAPDVNAVIQEAFEFDCPTPRPPSRTSGPEVSCSWKKVNDPVTDGNISSQMLVNDFATQWNNYVMVKNNNGGTDGNTCQVYHNGFKVIDANHLVNSPLPTPPMSRFLLGAMEDSIYQSHWVGSIDDFRVYDYALTKEQAAYIGTRGTGNYSHPMTAAGEIANLYTADTPGQRVNFRDYAVMVSHWLQQTQWP